MKISAIAVPVIDLEKLHCAVIGEQLMDECCDLVDDDYCMVTSCSCINCLYDNLRMFKIVAHRYLGND